MSLAVRDRRLYCASCVTTRWAGRMCAPKSITLSTARPVCCFAARVSLRWPTGGLRERLAGSSTHSIRPVDAFGPPAHFLRQSRRRRAMAISRSTRVNLLIGNGHFLSHLDVLCLPPLFVAWQSAFNVSFAELGLAVALMSGTTAILQTPVGFLVDRYGARPFLVGGALLMSLSMAVMGLAVSFWQILALATLSGVGNSVIHPADYAILSGSVDKDRMGRSFALHTFSGNLGFSAGPPVMALLTVAIGWRSSLILVGLLGIPVVVS